MTVAEFVGSTLARLGVGHAFGVVGSGNFHVTNALRAAGVPFVATRHEAGAATAADAWARTAGRLAVLTVHQGCGLTNAMTGITEAAKSRTPLLVLAADTGTGSVRSNFRIDQDGLVRAVGALTDRVHTPGISVECARWLAEEAPVIGIGVETVGTDAGAAHSFDPAFPCHSYVLGAGKYGLTQLQNLARLPATGAVVLAGPLPIVSGSGSPARVLALVER